MPIIDGPDFGSPNYDEASPVIGDVSSISDRQNHFSVIDNLGRGMVFENFQNGLSGWNFNTSGGGLTPSIQFPGQLTGQTMFAPAVCDLAPVQDGGQSLISRSFLDFDLNKIGIEVGFLNKSNIGDVQILVNRDFNMSRYTASIQYSSTDGVFTIQTDSGPVVIENLPTAATTFWVQMKIVLNPATGKLVRANIAGRFYDLTKYNAAFTPLILNPSYICSFQALAIGRAAPFFTDVLLSYLLLTRNEP